MSRLCEAFVWLDTPEGEEFWRAIDGVLDGSDVARPIPLPSVDHRGSYQSVSARACREVADRIAVLLWRQTPEGCVFWAMVYSRLAFLASGVRPTEPCVSAPILSAQLITQLREENAKLRAALKRIHDESATIIGREATE